MRDETPPPVETRQPGYYYVEGLSGPWYVHYDRRRWLAYQETPSKIGREIDLDASLIDGRPRQLQPVAKGPW